MEHSTIENEREAEAYLGDKRTVDAAYSLNKRLTAEKKTIFLTYDFGFLGVCYFGQKQVVQVVKQLTHDHKLDGLKLANT